MAGTTDSPNSSEWQASLNPCAGVGCCAAWCCYPCFNGNTKTKYDDSSCLVQTLINCVFPCFLTCTRGEIREGYGIEGDFVNDLLCTCCCPLCAAVQLRNEVMARGNISNYVQGTPKAGQVEATPTNTAQAGQ